MEAREASDNTRRNTIEEKPNETAMGTPKIKRPMIITKRITTDI